MSFPRRLKTAQHHRKEIPMDTVPTAAPVGKTIPSRPSKAAILMLVGVFIGFFVIMFSQSNDTLEKGQVAAPVAAPATQQ
jgi:hypothetical protein